MDQIPTPTLGQNHFFCILIRTTPGNLFIKGEINFLPPRINPGSRRGVETDTRVNVT